MTLTIIPPGASPAVLAAEYAELGRQEARVDTKVGHTATLAGMLTTLATAGVAGLATWSTTPWMLLAAIPLVAAATIWGRAVYVLMDRAVRPNFTGTGNPFGKRKLTMPLDDWYATQISSLAGIVYRRYLAIDQAVSLLWRGAWLLGTSAITAGVIRVLNVLGLV